MIKASKAFTIIEMLVAIALIGVIAAVILPMLFRRAPGADWKTIGRELNNLVAFTRQEAIANQKTHRLVFQRRPNEADSVRIEEELPNPEKPGQLMYKPAKSEYFSTTYKLPSTVKIKTVYMGRQEMFEEKRGVAYCYVIHDGLVQDVLVHLVRRIDNNEIVASYKMNPFLGRFEFYDGVLKPER